MGLLVFVPKRVVTSGFAPSGGLEINRLKLYRANIFAIFAAFVSLFVLYLHIDYC